MAQAVRRITRSPDVLGGEPRIDGSRVSVLHVYERVEGRGLDPKTVADRHDLDIVDVYQALAYYHANPQEMEEVRQNRRDIVDEHRDRSPTPEDIEGTE